jgi:hypothetical protein
MKSITFFICIVLLVTASKRLQAQTEEQLTIAYKENSKEKLKIFFDDWAEELKPASDKERSKMTKFKQETYNVFEAFFNPHDLEKVGGLPFGNDVYKRYNYFLIPQSLRMCTADKVYYTDEEINEYTVAQLIKRKSPDSLIQWAREGKSEQLIEFYGPYGLVYPDTLEKFVEEIHDFRPRIIQVPGTPIYLSAKYIKILTDFLGNTKVSFATGGMQNVAQAAGESKNRMAFLENFIKIYYGHWGGYWELSTPPVLLKVTFDKNFEYVKADFKMVYTGGTAYLKKVNGNWKLISAKRTWTE